MKTLRRTMAMMMMLFCMMSMNAARMSYYEMRSHARFLTDRMVYVLDLRPALLDELYLINYDYICGVNDYLDDIAMGYRYDDYNTILLSRDYALRALLGDVVWRLLTGYDYFYRPIAFVEHRWQFTVYVHDSWHGRLFYAEPVHYIDYRGGHYFGGMAVGSGVYRRTEYYDNRSGYVNRRNMSSYETQHASSNNYRGSFDGGRNADRDNHNNGNTGNRSGGRDSYNGSHNGGRPDYSSRSGNRSDYGSSSSGRSDYGSRSGNRSDYSSSSSSRSAGGFGTSRGSSRSNANTVSSRSSRSNNSVSTHTAGSSRGGGRR